MEPLKTQSLSVNMDRTAHLFSETKDLIYKMSSTQKERLNPSIQLQLIYQQLDVIDLNDQNQVQAIRNKRSSLEERMVATALKIFLKSTHNEPSSFALSTEELVYIHGQYMVTKSILGSIALWQKLDDNKVILKAILAQNKSAISITVSSNGNVACIVLKNSIRLYVCNLTTPVVTNFEEDSMISGSISEDGTFLNVTYEDGTFIVFQLTLTPSYHVSRSIFGDTYLIW